MSVRPRPRFLLPVPLAADAVMARIEAGLRAPGCPCRGRIAGHHRVVELRVPREDRHYWSPVLSLTVEEGSDGGSVVHGLLGPAPPVWTFFAMTWLGLATLVSFSALLGLVQWSLGMRPWGLWLVPLFAVVAVAVYLASRIGQGLAAPQTVLLRHYMEELLELPEAERAYTDRDPYHERPVDEASPEEGLTPGRSAPPAP